MQPSGPRPPQRRAQPKKKKKRLKKRVVASAGSQSVDPLPLEERALCGHHHPANGPPPTPSPPRPPRSPLLGLVVPRFALAIFSTASLSDKSSNYRRTMRSRTL